MSGTAKMTKRRTDPPPSAPFAIEIRPPQAGVIFVVVIAVAVGFVAGIAALVMAVAP